MFLTDINLPFTRICHMQSKALWKIIKKAEQSDELTLFLGRIFVHGQKENKEESNCSEGGLHHGRFLNDSLLYTELSCILVGLEQPNNVLRIPHYCQSSSNYRYLQSGREWPR